MFFSWGNRADLVKALRAEVLDDVAVELEAKIKRQLTESVGNELKEEIKLKIVEVFTNQSSLSTGLDGKASNYYNYNYDFMGLKQEVAHDLRGYVFNALKAAVVENVDSEELMNLVKAGVKEKMTGAVIGEIPYNDPDRIG